jgi:hypothetical protein
MSLRVKITLPRLGTLRPSRWTPCLVRDRTPKALLVIK